MKAIKIFTLVLFCSAVCWIGTLAVKAVIAKDSRIAELEDRNVKLMIEVYDLHAKNR